MQFYGSREEGDGDGLYPLYKMPGRRHPEAGIQCQRFLYHNWWTTPLHGKKIQNKVLNFPDNFRKRKIVDYGEKSVKFVQNI